MKNIPPDSAESTLPVAKVGGSLLALPDLATRLREWVAAERGPMVLIAGGGPWADLVRRADKRFQFGEEPSHWLAVSTMRTTARLLAAILPEAMLADEWPLDRAALIANRVTILDPWEFLQADAVGEFGPPLPQTWQVTSDSIAARLTHVLGARELVLLKSCPAPPDESPAALAKVGLVDEYFSRAAQGLKVRWVDLRSMT